MTPLHHFALRLVLMMAAYVAGVSAGSADELFRFVNNIHGTAITGQSAALVSQGGIGLSLAASPAGSLFNESNGQGLGVDSHLVPGVNDDASTAGRTKLNLIGGGLSVTPRISESIAFSFDRGGIIRDLLFDGVKDETLEFLRLKLPAGDVLTFFDFEVGLRLAAQGFSLATLTEPGLTLLTDGNDDRLGVNLSFQPGDVFELSYGEFPFPQGYVPAQNEAGNGARWEGMVVVAVPEPGTASFAGAIGLAAWLRRRRG